MISNYMWVILFGQMLGMRYSIHGAYGIWINDENMLVLLHNIDTVYRTRYCKGDWFIEHEN